MTAFLISTLRVKDPQKMQDYAAKAGASMAAYGGKPILRGGLAKALLGEASPHNVGVISFPDMKSVDDWFASKAYQELSELRNQACDMTLIAYQSAE